MPVFTARSGNGALALTGSSQPLLGVNSSRQVAYICNTSATNAMWIAYSGAPATSVAPVVAPTAAANTGIRLAPGQTLIESTYRGAVAVFGTAADVCSFIEL